ncbi:hypothetical protein T4D_14107 [Trichinella pseudospiralis]|uniref:Uncharacterized protein n=1 Tax=Trichinella pseudospiralis TaxID=6337 RepID=A0A0V1FF69_TRIPS|nr:hypothetical protein T4D_14107 [Trichinella pseudospiralis]
MPSIVEYAQKDMVAHWPDVAKMWSLLKINVCLLNKFCTTALPSRSRIIDAYAAILHSTLDVFLSKEERRCMLIRLRCCKICLMASSSHSLARIRLLPFPSLTRVSLCMGLRTKTFLFFFGTYDMMLQSLGKANLEEFNSLLMVALACSLFCREPLTCLGSYREFHLTACQCKFAYSMSSLTLGNRLPNT